MKGQSSTDDLTYAGTRDAARDFIEDSPDRKRHDSTDDEKGGVKKSGSKYEQKAQKFN